MIWTIAFAGLGIATLYVVIRALGPGGVQRRRKTRRATKILLAAWAALVLLFFGTCAVGLEDADAARRITECRTPLVGDTTCSGINDSWIECRWAFRAEGRPERSLCERFLQLPAGHRGNGETEDYDDVRSFSEVECSVWAVPDDRRCFEGVRREHEATNRYLQAFDSDCGTAVVLRSCNYPLDVAARQISSETNP